MNVGCVEGADWSVHEVLKPCYLSTLLVQAKTLSKGASSSECSVSPSRKEEDGRKPASSKHEGLSHRFQRNKKPEKAADLLETLAETAKNSKNDRQSGWRYRRKAQEKRHQKRKSSE